MRRTIIGNRGSVLAAFTVALICALTAQQAQAQTSQVAGTVTILSGNEVTIQTPGKAVGVISALTSAANRIGAEDWPYVWGGGHSQAGVASKGEPGGAGYNGKRIGYDCSGAVAAVLVAAGLWPSGSGVPSDAGVIKYLLAQHLIAKGAGVGPTEVTLYDHPGVHIFMNIDGRFWGTSDGGAGADPKGGPGWLDDGAPDVANVAFRRYHFLPGVLRTTTTAGDSFTFYYSPIAAPGLTVGTQVKVSYATSTNGTMVASSLTYTNQASAVGAVTAVGTGDTSFSVQNADDEDVTYVVTPGSTVAQQLASGQIAVNAVVTVTSVSGSSALTPTATVVTVDAPPPPTQPTTAVGVTGVG